MKSLSVDKLRRKGSKILLSGRKKLHQIFLPTGRPQSILFIVGCQRSGTSIMQVVFNRDMNARSFAEFSELSSNDSKSGIRLNPLELVAKEFSKVKAAFIIVKPLVESQNTLQLLDYFPNSRALWMYRHYREVALSNTRYFGLDNGIKDLRHIVSNEPGNWRAEKLSGSVRETVSRLFSEDMNPYDAAVIFWYTRNSLFFDQELDKEPRVLMCNYEDLVTQPDSYVRYLYEQVGQVYPGPGIVADIHTRSLRKGAGIELSPQVEQLAGEMMNRLEAAYHGKIMQGRWTQVEPARV